MQELPAARRGAARRPCLYRSCFHCSCFVARSLGRGPVKDLHNELHRLRDGSTVNLFLLLLPSAILVAAGAIFPQTHSSGRWSIKLSLFPYKPYPSSCLHVNLRKLRRSWYCAIESGNGDASVHAVKKFHGLKGPHVRE